VHEVESRSLNSDTSRHSHDWIIAQALLHDVRVREADFIASGRVISDAPDRWVHYNKTDAPIVSDFSRTRKHQVDGNVEIIFKEDDYKSTIKSIDKDDLRVNAGLTTN
jgi:hypothetical protein